MARGSQTLYVRGRGDWLACAELLQPLLAGPNSSQASLVGAYKAPIDFGNSEFYGFSEFFYCTEDVLRLGGRYSAPTFTAAAQVGAAPAQGAPLSQGWEGVGAISCSELQLLCPPGLLQPAMGGADPALPWWPLLSTR